MAAAICVRGFPDTGVCSVDETIARGMFSSVGGSVSPSEIRANCISYRRIEVRRLRPGEFEVCDVASDHPASDVSAAFLKESNSRPIITGIYLRVELVSSTSPKDVYET